MKRVACSPFPYELLLFELKRRMNVSHTHTSIATTSTEFYGILPPFALQLYAMRSQAKI